MLSPKRQRTEFPLACELLLRLTSELPEFRLRFQALEPEMEEVHQLPFEPTLLSEPSVLRLPAGKNKKSNTASTLKVITYSSYICINIDIIVPHKRGITGLKWHSPK